MFPFESHPGGFHVGPEALALHVRRSASAPLPAPRAFPHITWWQASISTVSWLESRSAVRFLDVDTDEPVLGQHDIGQRAGKGVIQGDPGIEQPDGQRAEKPQHLRHFHDVHVVA